MTDSTMTDFTMTDFTINNPTTTDSTMNNPTMTGSTLTIRSLPEKPAYPYREAVVSALLEIADSYLAHADRLIYSFGSKTFLSGYDIFDSEHEGRGNIDCSTFVLLVLAGVSYEQSPYASGNVKAIPLTPLTPIDFSCIENVPERFIGIAERIGRPYLAGPKGLDLDKAASMGISMDQLLDEIRNCGTSRKSVDLAKAFYKQGACFTDSSYLMPGDLVFYQSKSFFSDSNYKPTNITEVTHVGIILPDTKLMINSSGYLNKERAEQENLAAVSVSPVAGKRIPLFYVRPDYDMAGRS